eukprot:4132549-Pleurochrysis_carterae.AAC.4
MAHISHIACDASYSIHTGYMKTHMGMNKQQRNIRIHATMGIGHRGGVDVLIENEVFILNIAQCIHSPGSRMRVAYYY